MKKYKSNFIIILIGIIVIFLIIFYILSFLRTFFSKNDVICENCNVILISIDNLRADHLGCYGYYKNTSPNIDELAKNGIIFTNTITQATWTVSHLPILSSLYVSTSFPSYLNSSNISMLQLQVPNYTVLLPQVLKEKNYVTAAFVNAPILSSFYNYNKGFDFFDEEGALNRVQYGDIKNVNNRIINWLENNSKNKFFLFIHYYDVHDPYNPDEKYFKLFDENYTDYTFLNNKLGNCGICDVPLDKSNISEKEREIVTAAYDGKIRYTDENIKKLIDKLKELGIIKNSIIIITADHGNPLGDHGQFSHGYQFYDESLHVPLIFILPENQRKIIKSQVRSIDIMPTILDILGFQIPNYIDGESLVPFIEGKETNLVAFTESFSSISMRDNNIKFILNIKTGKEELYNLSNDPKEKFNIANNISTEKFKLEISKFIENNKNKFISLSKNNELITEINETKKKEIEERLKELGYVT